MKEHPLNGVFGVYSSCKVCKIGQSCFLKGMPQKEVEQFEQIIERKLVLKKGANLFEQNKPFASIYVVQQGCLKSYSQLGDDSPQITAFYFPGDLIGLNAIHSQQHPDSVEAVETSTLCELPYDSVMQLIRNLPILQHNFFRLFSYELNKIQQARACLRQKSARGRYAAFLLWLKDRYQEFNTSTDSQIPLSMPRSDIADYLNLTPETICRISGRFQKQGLIQVDNNKVGLSYPEGLKQLAGCSKVRPEISNGRGIDHRISLEGTHY